MDITQEDDVVKVARPTDESQDKAFHGLTLLLINQLIQATVNSQLMLL